MYQAFTWLVPDIASRQPMPRDIHTWLPFAARNQDEHSPGSGLLRMPEYASRVLRRSAPDNTAGQPRPDDTAVALVKAWGGGLSPPVASRKEGSPCWALLDMRAKHTQNQAARVATPDTGRLRRRVGAGLFRIRERRSRRPSPRSGRPGPVWADETGRGGAGGLGHLESRGESGVTADGTT